MSHWCSIPPMVWKPLARLPMSSNTLIPILHRWRCSVPGPPTTETRVRIYEMVKDCTFQDMFGGFGVGLDSLALTQAQIKQFAKRRGDWLKKGGNGTFFLFKTGNEFFVAAVYFFSDGRLGVRVRDLTLERVFRAQKRHRVVVKSF